MKTDTPRTPEELLESMTGMFLPPSAMGEVNGLKILCLQRENAALKAEVKRLKAQLNQAVEIADYFRIQAATYNPDYNQMEILEAEVDKIKATLNPETK